MGAYSAALTQLEAAQPDLVRWGTPDLKALHCLVFGIVAEQAGRLDSAIEHMRGGHALYSDLHDDRVIAESAMRLGYVVFNWRGDLGTSQALLDEALRLYRKLGDPPDLAEAIDHVGLIRYMAGRLDESEQYYIDAPARARKIGHHLVIAKAIGGLAWVAWGRQQWETAITLFEQRVKLMQEIGHENQVLAGLNFLCGVYADAGRVTDALALIAYRPDMWRTAWTAHAQISAGQVADAMNYLLPETASCLKIESTYNLARYLIAWAMVLLSDQLLVTGAEPEDM